MFPTKLQDLDSNNMCWPSPIPVTFGDFFMIWDLKLGSYIIALQIFPNLIRLYGLFWPQSRVSLEKVVDNYYTSINLFYELSKFKTDGVGTVRRNRKGLPQVALKHKWKKKTEKGNRMVLYCDRFFIMNWMDSKEVIILSSISNALKEEDQANTVKGRIGYAKPQVIHEYNRVIPGFDLNDQMKFGRKVARRRVKTFYKNIFFHQFDTALVNSYILGKKIPSNGSFPNVKIKQNVFRMLLVKGLVGEFGTEVGIDEELPIPGTRAEEMHIPTYSRKNGRKLCHLCNKKTASACPRCELHLCSIADRNCFENYHFENRFSLSWKPVKKRLRIE